MDKKICDLHCDLLLYLAGDSSRTAFDEKARCSIPQLQKGKVALQVMAVFTESSLESAQRGSKQIQIFQQLPKKYPEHFTPYQGALKSKKIHLLYAIESASGFCNEEESLDDGFKRLESYMQNVGKPLYISLTWNTENRFGGGNMTQKGLKEDGKTLLEYLSGKKIAVDLSHTSDALARDICNYIDEKKLQIPLIASHSNYRSITEVERNLPDWLAKEIIQRGGVIGFNFVRPFISFDPLPSFSPHLKHAINLGAENHVCFGADFFYDEDIDNHHQVPFFFEGYGNSSCYEQVLNQWREHLGITENQVAKICHQNFFDFLKRFQV